MKDHLIIGVLALQGGFSKHIAMVRSLGIEAREVRTPEELKECDALIIPGGESTVIYKQLNFIGLTKPLQEFAKEKPVFGTCAGLILISKKIISDEMKPFNLIDVEVERNAFGRQPDSFSVSVNAELDKNQIPFQAVFIRAPRIRSCGSKVKVLAKFKDEPILIRQGIHLGATFHPELTSDSSIHQYFIELVRSTKK